jgi:hypothetical protein
MLADILKRKEKVMRITTINALLALAFTLAANPLPAQEVQPSDACRKVLKDREDSREARKDQMYEDLEKNLRNPAMLCEMHKHRLGIAENDLEMTKRAMSICPPDVVGKEVPFGTGPVVRRVERLRKQVRDECK